MQLAQVRNAIPQRYRKPLLAGALVLCFGAGTRVLLHTVNAARASGEVRRPVPLDVGDAGKGRKEPAARVNVPRSARDPFDVRHVLPVRVATAPATAPAASAPVARHVPTLEEVARQARASLRLEGASVSAQPMVIVNGRIYTVGEKVEGFVIRAIRVRTVVLARDGHEVTVTCD